MTQDYQFCRTIILHTALLIGISASSRLPVSFGEDQSQQKNKPKEYEQKIFETFVNSFVRLADQDPPLEDILGLPNSTVAASAYWRMLNSLPAGERVVNYHKLMKNRKQFVGYLSAKLSFVPPDWWEDSLLKESLTFNDSALKDFRYLFADEDGLPVFKWADRAYERELNMHQNLILARGLRISKATDEELVFLVGDKGRVIVGKDTEKEMLELGGMLKVHPLLEGAVLILCSPIAAQPMTIYRLDGIGHLKWKDSIWGHGYSKSRRTNVLGRASDTDFYFGKDHEYHHLKCSVHSDKLLVFGADFAGAYVEAFDLQSGEVLLRFSSFYTSLIMPPKDRSNE